MSCGHSSTPPTGQPPPAPSRSRCRARSTATRSPIRLILSPELRASGAQTLTVFGLHVPDRLVDESTHDACRDELQAAVLASLDGVLAEPVEPLLLLDAAGRPTIETKTTLDLEHELAMPGGNIFHGALDWPFVEDDAALATPAERWGVATGAPPHPAVRLWREARWSGERHRRTQRGHGRPGVHRLVGAPGRSAGRRHGRMVDMKVGILTSGGDCPGLNAVIRASVLKGLQVYGTEFVGFRDGWRGVIEADAVPLKRKDIQGIAKQGGTILGTSRTNPFEGDGGSERVQHTMTELGVDALIAIGGEGTLAAAKRLSDAGIRIVGVPKTIDNDLSATDYTFGFDTAVQIATEAMDRLRTTGDSHRRCMVAEVMGRHVGWIALHSGMAAGAHAILIPEQRTSMDQIVEWVTSVRDRDRAPLVVVAEGFRLDTMDDPHSERGLDAFGRPRLGGIGDTPRAADRGAHGHGDARDDARAHPARRHADRLRPRARHPVRARRDRRGGPRALGPHGGAARHDDNACGPRGRTRQAQHGAAGPLRRGRDPVRLMLVGTVAGDS